MEQGREGRGDQGTVSTPAALQLVIGFSPGSASDEIARLVAPELAAVLGREVQVVPLPGENGAKAARHVAAAKPDGNTIFVATLGTHAVAPHYSAKCGYHAIRDFEPVSLLVHAPMVLGVNSQLHVNTVNDLIAIAQEKPGAITYATSAHGGAPHLAAELFQAMAAVELQHVTYRHTERLYDDLAEGRVMLSFNNIKSMLPRCHRGGITAVATTGTTRSAVAPELPTMAESGLPGYDMSNWVALSAPKGTPRHALDVLGAACGTVMHAEGVVAQLSKSGVTAVGSSPGMFADFLAKENARWRPVVKQFSRPGADTKTIYR